MPIASLVLVALILVPPPDSLRSVCAMPNFPIRENPEAMGKVPVPDICRPLRCQSTDNPNPVPALPFPLTDQHQVLRRDCPPSPVKRSHQISLLQQEL